MPEKLSDGILSSYNLLLILVGPKKLVPHLCLTPGMPSLMFLRCFPASVSEFPASGKMRPLHGSPWFLFRRAGRAGQEKVVECSRRAR